MTDEFYLTTRRRVYRPSSGATASFVVVQMVQTATLILSNVTLKPITFAAPGASTTPQQFDPSSLRGTGTHTHAGISVPGASCVVISADAAGTWLLGLAALMATLGIIPGPNAQAAGHIRLYVNDTPVRQAIEDDDLAANSAADLAPVHTPTIKLFLMTLVAGDHVWGAGLSVTSDASVWELWEAIQTMVRLF